MKMPDHSISNYQSELLTQDQNNQVFKLLGNRCQTLSTTVVQLFCSRPPNHQHWVKEYTGVLCFVKDNTRKNYFFQLYCINSNRLLWEHEMYNNMEYNESTKFFHIFEGELGIVAFNFADTVEASHFRTMVENKIFLRKRRENKRSSKQLNNSNFDPNVFKKEPDIEKKLAKRSRNITKADIGMPTGFKHITHVGWNKNSGFDINTEDEVYKEFFAKAGVSDEQLADKETRDFIYGFINNHGGVDAVVDQTSRRAPPPPPSQGANGPPVPPRGSQRTPHVRAAPPPPPSRPPPIQMEKPMAPPIPKPSGAAINVPPPPPPPPMMPSPTFESHSPAPVSSAGIDTSALMNSIRNGTNLKPVSQDDNRPPLQDHNPRNDLLGEIRKGLTLKPVAEREVKISPKLSSEPAAVDLAGALAKALAERSRAIHSEDDDDEDESTDDEWKD